MSIDLVVPNPIASGMQPVQDQNNSNSALNISIDGILVVGKDVAGGSLPVIVQGSAVGSGQQTWYRLVRLIGVGNQFFDIGIDQGGNLFLNGPNSTATNHILTISQSGTITIP
jgi:hypothetical protein